MSAPIRRGPAPKDRALIEACDGAAHQDTAHAVGTPTVSGSYVRVDADPETIAADLIEKAGPARVLELAAALVEQATGNGQQMVIPVGPNAAAVALAGRFGGRGIALEWALRLAASLGHPLATEADARRLIGRLDALEAELGELARQVADHEARLDTASNRVTRLEVNR